MQSGPSRSVAGVRTVARPAVLIDELRAHVAEFFEPTADGLVFVGKRGGELRRGNFHRETNWTKTVIDAVLPAGFHFHDLRHTGNQLAAASGATTRELMHRMGHGSMRAALIYQHASSGRDRTIADQLSALVDAERRAADEASGERARDA